MSCYQPKIKRKHHRYRRKHKPDFTEYLRVSGVAETRTRQFIKRQLINSKGPVCGICGKPITNMKDCTIDHIVPICKGGMTTVDNCQLAHFKCNNQKADQQFDQH